jgi:anti-sigma factor RsiW
MKVVPFGETACEKTRRYLDSYLSSELLVETNREVLRHLESCPECSAELAARSRMRTALRAAVSRAPVPAGLENRIGQALRTRPIARRYMLAAAAVLACVALVSIWRLRPNPSEQDLIRQASQRLSTVLNVGLRDHLHCAVFRKYSKQPEPLPRMASALGPEFAGLVPLVQAKVPAEFRVIQGHHCEYNGRPYTHLILTSGDKLVSVILTRKQPGESLNGGISQAGIDRFQVVGFESRDYLAYVISDLDPQRSLQLAANLAPALREYLAAHAG